MSRSAADFSAKIAGFDARLSAIGADTASRQIRPGGWRGIEVLGHLVDSALNNHQRFVRAALDGAYAGPGYNQQGWVALHGYVERSWADLLNEWRVHNTALARVVDRIPAKRFAAECRVGEGVPVTLGFLVEDYLRHLEHHVAQIEGMTVEK